jgi:pSer/pThr/pTyr-binding forkhead associated (FHA) protein
MQEAQTREPIAFAILEVRWVGGFGDAMPLTRPTIRVGRSPRNDLIVEHPALSGRHLEILFRDGAAYVQDLGSRNATFLDGRRLAPNETSAVVPQATIRLHDCLELRLLPPDRSTAVTPMPECVQFARRPQPGLIILQRGAPMRRIALGARAMTLGRGSGNDIVLDSLVVSSQHAEIIARGGDRFAIADLGSCHGLTYEGRRVDGKPLMPGDRLYIADQVMIEFQPVMGLFTEASPRKRPSLEPAEEPARRLGVCPGCGATNFGPQTACLRCQAPLRQPG